MTRSEPTWQISTFQRSGSIVVRHERARRNPECQKRDPYTLVGHRSKGGFDATLYLISLQDQ